MSDYLSNVSMNKALKINEDVFVYSYSDLVIQLRILTDSEFKRRFNDGREIIEWVHKNFKDEQLLSRIELVTTRREFAHVIEKRIAQLERQKGNKKREPEKLVLPFYVNVIFFFVFVAVMLSFLRYAYLSDDDSRFKYRELNGELQAQVDDYVSRIIYLEGQNMDLKQQLDAKNQIEFKNSVLSPADRIRIENITSNNSVVLVRINNSYLAEFTDTDSMLPVLDENAIGIEIVPLSESEIFEGDIISYALPDNSVVIHRVVEIGTDSEGWYAVTKGDSNPVNDKDKVRFSQIKGVLVGVLY